MELDAEYSFAAEAITEIIELSGDILELLNFLIDNDGCPVLDLDLNKQELIH
jgi:hypothetical protein